MDLLDDLLEVEDVPHEMNPDLAAWAQEHGVATSSTEPVRAVHGPCRACDRPATMRCIRCEKAVCARHHHVMLGVCLVCQQQGPGPEPLPETSAEPAAPFADEHPHPRADLDLDWID